MKREGDRSGLAGYRRPKRVENRPRVTYSVFVSFAPNSTEMTADIVPCPGKVYELADAIHAIDGRAIAL